MDRQSERNVFNGKDDLLAPIKRNNLLQEMGEMDYIKGIEDTTNYMGQLNTLDMIHHNITDRGASTFLFIYLP